MLAEPDREFALQVAKTRSENGPSLNDAAWRVVKNRGHTREEYALALRRAEAAAADEADLHRVFYLKTLGVAQYRVGLFAEAIATLTRRARLKLGTLAPLVSRMDLAGLVKINGPRGSLSWLDPTDLAILAMVQHQSVEKKQAQETLGYLRKRVAQYHADKVQEAQSFLREAEAVVQMAMEKPKK
jgi:hypothetical protein